MTSFNFLNFEMVDLHNKAVFLFFPLGLLGLLGCMCVCVLVSSLLAE